MEIRPQPSGPAVVLAIDEFAADGLDSIAAHRDRRLRVIHRRRLNARLLGAGSAVAWIAGLAVAVAIAASALVGLR